MAEENPRMQGFKPCLAAAVDSLFVWFPASWMPLVVDATREKSFAYNQVVSQLGAVAFTDQIQTGLGFHLQGQTMAG